MASVSTSPRDGIHDIAKYGIPGLALIGALLICAPLLLNGVVDRSFKIEWVAHPAWAWWVAKVFELIGKVGDACLIAALIGWAVDKGLKLKLIEEVVLAASPKLWLRHLPDSVQDGLAESLRDINFVRPNWIVEYTLTPLEGAPDMLQVATSLTGTVLNCRSRKETFNFIGGVDSSGTRESLVTRVSMSPEFGTSLFDLMPNNAELRQPDGSKLYQQATSLEAGRRYETLIQTLEFRPTSFIMPLFTATTVATAVVRIRYPKDLLEIQVYTATDSALTPTDTGWGQEWQIAKPILPGQCIVASWLPRPGPSLPAASKTAAAVNEATPAPPAAPAVSTPQAAPPAPPGADAHPAAAATK